MTSLDELKAMHASGLRPDISADMLAWIIAKIEAAEKLSAAASVAVDGKFHKPAERLKHSMALFYANLNYTCPIKSK